MNHVIAVSLKCSGVLALLSMRGVAQEIPQSALSSLASPKFREREIAQVDLLNWARRRPTSAMDELLQQSRLADDPEVRERCLSVLRSLITDEYMKEGEGYLGISLKDEISNVPGETNPRGVIRVLMVQPRTPAERAGFRENDLIVGINGEVWQDALFRANIRMMKPNTKVDIRVLREGELVDLKITLGRRPLSADMTIFPGQSFDHEATELAAKEAYFRRWLNQRKLPK